MDDSQKKVLCCAKLHAELEIYNKLADGLTKKDLAAYNEAADRAIAELVAVRESLLGTA